MAKPFDHFLPETRNILILAQRLADRKKQPINSGHIILATLKLQNSIVYEILINNSVDQDKFEIALNIEKQGTSSKTAIETEAKDIIKSALAIAKKHNHRVVSPEHLILAVISHSDSVGLSVLKKIKVSTAGIKREINDLFNQADQIKEPNQGQEIAGNNLPPEMIEQEGVGTGIMMPGRIGQKKKKILPSFSTNLVAEAKKNKLDPLIGRESEVNRAIQILNRRIKNNPILVGEAGVGKTAIAEGLAQRIAKGEVPARLKSKQIISLDLSLLLAGTKYRGQFEERIKQIVKEIKADPKIIVFLDEVHNLAGAGAAEGSIDAANIIKPALAKGDLRLIGSTTLEEYRKYIEKDSALERRLQMIKVSEPTPYQAKKILKGLKKKYEKHHQVKITPEAINSAVELSVRYITSRKLPDKAIDLIDEAASALSLKHSVDQPSEENTDLEKKIKETIKSKEKAVIKQDYEKAASQREKELELKQKLVNKPASKSKTKKQFEVEESDIAQVVAEWTSIPVSNLLAEERKKYMNLEREIKKKIVGQNETVKKLAQAIRRSRAGISQSNRPIGSFVFLGPTGVGKTELAKVLAKTLFNRENALIRIDMSEFRERHNVSKLIGAPPGYVGYDEGGKLTEQVKQNPYSVVLLDELEKAHPDVQNVLLQVMEDGYLTDGQSRKIDFSNTVIIMTSNIGTKKLSKEAAVGFQASGGAKQKFNQRYKKMKQKILTDLKDHFRPEFINRIDEIMVFKPLTPANIKKIAQIQVDALIKRIKDQKKIKLDISQGAVNYIARKGFDPDLGARPIRRLITNQIENQISEQIFDKSGLKKIKVISNRKGGLKISN